jgi:hypothetical protein
MEMDLKYLEGKQVRVDVSMKENPKEGLDEQDCKTIDMLLALHKTLEIHKGFFVDGYLIGKKEIMTRMNVFSDEEPKAATNYFVVFKNKDAYNKATKTNNEELDEFGYGKFYREVDEISVTEVTESSKTLDFSYEEAVNKYKDKMRKDNFTILKAT